MRATADIAGTVLTDSMRWIFSGSLASIRIKAGDISGYLTKAGQRYGSDTYFSGGKAGSINPPDTRASERIAVAAEDAGIYDSFREGAFAYRVPVPSGRYQVTVKFEEPSAREAGIREFNVVVNGKIILERFDIFSAAGSALKGVDRSFDSASRDGTMLIEFVPLERRRACLGTLDRVVIDVTKRHRVAAIGRPRTSSLVPGQYLSTTNESLPVILRLAHLSLFWRPVAV